MGGGKILIISELFFKKSLWENSCCSQIVDPGQIEYENFFRTTRVKKYFLFLLVILWEG